MHHFTSFGSLPEGVSNFAERCVCWRSCCGVVVGEDVCRKFRCDALWYARRSLQRRAAGAAVHVLAWLVGSWVIVHWREHV